MEQILDLARWAPSGDNSQVWRFEIISDFHVVVHGFDTRDHCVYDLNGHASQIALGALLENIEIAASGHGLTATSTYRSDSPETRPAFDVQFTKQADTAPNPLLPFIIKRSVQRRPFKTTKLALPDKNALEQALPSGYRIMWMEDFPQKLAMSKLLFNSAKIRLTIPEAYAVHSKIIQWRARFSEDRVPDQSIGLDPLSTRLMEWVMRSWPRVEFFNKYLGGTLLPRLQLDFIPALACGAHFVLIAPHAPRGLEDFIHAGRALQRFWLTATELSLCLQPEITPLIFSDYARKGQAFSTSLSAGTMALKVDKRLSELVGTEAREKMVFMGRIGEGAYGSSRSLRLPLKNLIIRRSN